MITEKIAAIKIALNELTKDERLIIEGLLKEIEPLLRKAESDKEIQPSSYHLLVQTLAENPYHRFLIQKLLEKIENTQNSEQQTEGSHTKAQLQLKHHTVSDDKTLRLKNAIKFFENRKSLSLELAKSARAKNIKPATPKLIMALDALLDLITSFFAEPPRKNKKHRLVPANLRPPGSLNT